MTLIQGPEEPGQAAGRPAAPEAPAAVNLNAAGRCGAWIAARRAPRASTALTDVDGDDLTHGCGWLAGRAVLGERDRARL